MTVDEIKKRLESIAEWLDEDHPTQGDCKMAKAELAELRQLLQALVSGQSEQLPPNLITDRKYEDLMKALYPKDNSKRFRR